MHFKIVLSTDIIISKKTEEKGKEYYVWKGGLKSIWAGQILVESTKNNFPNYMLYC
jgi:hypothetical protein